jgi:predicted HD phosphohydrolase
MKKIGPHTDDAPLDRRRLFEQALGGLSALALLRGLGACAADDAEPLAPGAPSPAAVNGAAGSGAAPAVPAGATQPGPAASSTSPTAAATSTSAVPPSAMAAPAAPDSAAPGPRAACEVAVTSFPNLADGGPATTFTRMDQSGRADWIAIGGATSRLAAKVPDGILNLLRALDKLYMGYPISVLAHSLQTATRAMQANAPDDLVLGALCHDIGMAITPAGHSELSAAILRGYVSDQAYRVVRHHTEFEWLRGGAPSGQPTDQRDRYKTQPWFGDAARFIDDWESISYDPAFSSRTLEDFEDLVRAKFSAATTVNSSTAMDCLPPGGGKMP